ncbi:MAG TPA: TIGR02147 family protein, partial [Fibrobacteria bacterium]|nr:TIGR02147 family protein [Fibrobacteria bacterium]
MEAKSIYDYSDFRAFLSDWFAQEKEKRGKFTKAQVSRELGLPNSRNYFSDLLGGKELSDTFLERLIGLLALPRDQARYFRALVNFQQAATPEKREEALDQLVS